jgi:hypothetical protein
MIGHITIQLDGFLNLELNCEYDYEKAAPETDIDPPEQAVVELISAEINGQVVALNNTSTTRKKGNFNEIRTRTRRVVYALR